jgi:DNA topoisomerase-1
VFLAANTFPKSRETRAPLVEELQRFRDRLPEKLSYLADAPVSDEEGNKAVVRFSRKTKQQYVSTEKDGKATGWSAFYVDGKWEVASKATATKAAPVKAAANKATATKATAKKAAKK